MKQLITWLLAPPVTGPSSILIIRWMIATIYIWEIIGKFIDGAPISFMVISELLGSILLLLGLLTRVTCVLFIIEIVVSFPALWPSGLLTRLEYAQLLSCFFLLFTGPGRRSLDFRISTAGKIYRLN